jgi:hypothetical protein
VEFTEIPLFNEVKPYPRASHSMIGINGDNIVLVGGVGLDGDNKNKILRDIWLFNTEELSWTRVDPMNGVSEGILLELAVPPQPQAISYWWTGRKTRYLERADHNDRIRRG